MEPDCEGCEHQTGVSGVRPDAWVMHLIWLENLMAAGCSFRLDELEIEEWQGLIMLKSVRSEREAEKIREMRNKGMQT